ncbi:Similar to hypothetical protein [Tuber melanosporum Mel28]; acc. no. XP_002839943 [Pyronema omphalodes CBS 100304]|uniref:Peroxisomal membrane protein PEX14 n=1 Tax=Pyronema omphalodes (strain CBS 100304) TaxID=1076935 RepID=U4LJB7_PYROM|nr:Similar to hypothetical protein [Tuber melanosporum Mel28]; acc. no. XP_002839943 [Pyronema omphalodes CBS 100304]
MPPKSDEPKNQAVPTKFELPEDLKSIHDSPAPRDGPISQPDDQPTNPEEREKLLENAITFLERSRDAPLDQKQEFLRAKGLSPEEVEDLILKLERKQRKREGKRRERNGQLVRAEKSVQPAPQQQVQPQQFTQQPAPTILTYPEWLAPPPPAPPRPLVTGPTIVKALYFGAATAATVYGANKFVVTPMLDGLTSARMDFAETVKTNLDKFTESLMELTPSGYVPGKFSQRPRDSDEESEASDISDPSELFHVDAQTQTDESLMLHGDEDGAMTPDSKLEELTSQMKVLVESHSDGTDNELTFLLEDLTSYLEGLTYDSAVSSSIYASPFGGFSQGGDKDKDDPIVKVKQEIRSVKGVLLNTKNFPAIR